MLQQFLEQIYEAIHICPNFVINVLETLFFDFLESFLSFFQKVFSLDNVIIIIAGWLIFSSAYKFVSRFSFFQNIKCSFWKKITKSQLSSAEKKSKPYFNYAPIDLSKDISDPSLQEQFRQLDFYLQDEKVKNLAIFGALGSGKSSLVETYFNSDKFDRKENSDAVIYISLPDFEYEDKSGDEKLNNNYHKQNDCIHESGTEQNLNKLEPRNVEKKTNKRANKTDITNVGSDLNCNSNKLDANNVGSVLNSNSNKLDISTVESEIIRQIIYSKINKNVPISVISNLKFDKKIQTIFSIVTFCIVFLCLQQMFNDDFKINHYLQFSCYSVAAFTCIFYFVFYVVKWLFTSFKLSNVSFQSNGVGIEHKSKSCLFDSYIDEITYLFEESNCKYVVFEDLDRTENYEVLTHLRNLNQILNNDPRCKYGFFIKQRKIVFIYLLNNSIFKNSNEAVKFFDASINVEPVITSTNSWEFLKNYRDNLHLYYEKSKDSNELKLEFLSKEFLDDQFLISISRFLCDLRLIKQIFNDYQLLIAKLDWLFTRSTNENFRKKIVKESFSFAVFRCVFTKEYDNLNRNKGITYNILNRKYQYTGLDSFDIENNSFYELAFKEIIDPNLISELQSNELLKVLLINNYISENYRLFAATISSKTFCNRKNDMHFLADLIIGSANYFPKFKISEFSVEVALHYFPNTIFLCNRALNYGFLGYLTYIYVIAKNQKHKLLLDRYVKFIFDSFLSLRRKEGNHLVLSSNGNNVQNIVFELCDYFEKLKVANIKLEKGNVNQCKNEWLKLVFSRLRSSEIIYQNYESIFGSNLGKFLFYVLEFGQSIILEDLRSKDKKVIPIILQDIKKLDAVNKFQPLLVNDSKLINSTFFQSAEYINFKIKYIISSLSMKDESSYKYIKEISNYYKINREPNIVSFIFEPTWFNFSQISKYLRDKYSDETILQKDISVENNLLTTIFTTINKNIEARSEFKEFGMAFYCHLFFVGGYENLLFSTGIDTRYKIKDSNVDFLQDSPEVVLFSLLSLNYSYLEKQSIFESNTKKEYAYCVKSPDKLEILKFYEGTDFEKVVNCFLDHENCEILKLSNKFLENSIKTRSLFKDWCNFVNGDWNFKEQLAKNSLLISLTQLLNYSFIKKNCKLTPKHRIAPNITNIVQIRNFLEQYLKESKFDEKYKFEINKNYQYCWSAFSKYFYNFYDDILLTNSKFELSSKFTDAPYSTEKTRDYILSIKEKT